MRVVSLSYGRKNNLNVLSLFPSVWQNRHDGVLSSLEFLWLVRLSVGAVAPGGLASITDKLDVQQRHLSAVNLHPANRPDVVWRSSRLQVVESGFPVSQPRVLQLIVTLGVVPASLPSRGVVVHKGVLATRAHRRQVGAVHPQLGLLDACVKLVVFQTPTPITIGHAVQLPTDVQQTTHFYSSKVGKTF